MMDSPTTYKLFKLKNREFTFDVDVSNMPGGLNGALYFVDMDRDGGMSKYPNNKAGAEMGTGYCDAQCPADVKFINGEANILGWAPDPNGDPNSGDGLYGTCCTELDIWEANIISTAITPHMCTVDGQYRCNGTECGHGAGQRFLGVCDEDGCDLNPWRSGDQDFYGPGQAPPVSKRPLSRMHPTRVYFESSPPSASCTPRSARTPPNRIAAICTRLARRSAATQ